MTLTITPLLSPTILHLSEVLPLSVLPDTFQLFLQAAVMPGSQLLIWKVYHAHVCFCDTCVFISSLCASPYQPFKNMTYKPFHTHSFGSTHAYTILCNSHDVFPLPQKIGSRIEGSMTTIGTYVFFPLCPSQCQV